MLTRPAVAYQPAYEQRETDEEGTEATLNEQMAKIRETTFKDEGRALRSVHAKSHGLLRGRLEVAADLPPVLAQGLFARPGAYEVIIRLSTIPGDLIDDNISTPRGMSIKVLGVEGEMLPDSKGPNQDFILVNGPAFSAANGKTFAQNLKLLAATTDKAEGLKKVLSAANQGLETLVEAVGGESANLKTLGGHPKTHPLGETYYSQTPFLYGDYMAKFSVAPVSPGLQLLKDKKIDIDGPDGLRDHIRSYFAETNGVWEFRVQLNTSLEDMPVEDAHKVWDEDDSPYITVARLVADKQEGWSEALSREIDDCMQFSVWHGLAAHRPLGSVNRLRRKAYDASAEFRFQRNSCPVHHAA